MNLGRFLTARYRNRSRPVRPVTAVTGPVPAGFFNPDHSRIHPVVRVSQLKKQVPPLVEVTPNIAAITIDPDAAVPPRKIIDHRLVPHAGATTLRVKVQWSGLSSSLATWEDEDDFRRFPQSIALGSGPF